MISRRREAPASAGEALPSGALDTQVGSQWRCVMKRSVSFLTAAAALGFAAVGFGQTSPGPQRGEASAAAPQPSADAEKRLAAVVPSGMSPQEACAEFRSIEECATALHLA